MRYETFQRVASVDFREEMREEIRISSQQFAASN